MGGPHFWFVLQQSGDQNQLVTLFRLGSGQICETFCLSTPKLSFALIRALAEHFAFGLPPLYAQKQVSFQRLVNRFRKFRQYRIHTNVIQLLNGLIRSSNEQHGRQTCSFCGWRLGRGSAVLSSSALRVKRRNGRSSRKLMEMDVARQGQLCVGPRGCTNPSGWKAPSNMLRQGSTFPQTRSSVFQILVPPALSEK